jgi:hypothetical protein
MRITETICLFAYGDPLTVAIIGWLLTGWRPVIGGEVGQSVEGCEKVGVRRKLNFILHKNNFNLINNTF